MLKIFKRAQSFFQQLNSCFRNLKMTQKIPDINLFTHPKIRHPQMYRSASGSKLRDTSFDSYACSSSNSNFNRPRSYKWDKINSTSDYYLEAMRILSKSKQFSNSSSSLNLFENWKSRGQIKQNTRVLFPYNFHDKNTPKKAVFTQNQNKDNQLIHNLLLSPENTGQTKISSFPQPHKVMINEVAPRFTQQVSNQGNLNGAPNLLLQQKNLQRVGSTPLLMQNALIKPKFCVPLEVHNPNAIQHNPNIQINYVQKPKIICPNEMVQNIQLLNPKIVKNNQTQVLAKPNRNNNAINLNQNQLVNYMFSQNMHQIKQFQKEEKVSNKNPSIAKVQNQNFQRQLQNLTQNGQTNLNFSLNQTMKKIIKKMDNTFSSNEFNSSFSSEMSKAANQVQAHILLDQLAQMKNENIQAGNNYISKIDDIINRYNSKKEKNNTHTGESLGKNKQKIELTVNSSKSIDLINN